MPFVRCDSLDKLHLCTSQGFQEHLWPIGTVNTINSHRLMSEAIFTCIPGDIKLRNLYLRWISLSPEEQSALSENFCGRELQIGRYDLFVPLKQAYSHWDYLQNTAGAPGIQSGLHAFTCNRLLNEDLECLIVQIDQYLDQVSNPIYEQASD